MLYIYFNVYIYILDSSQNRPVSIRAQGSRVFLGASIRHLSTMYNFIDQKNFIVQHCLRPSSAKMLD